MLIHYKVKFLKRSKIQSKNKKKMANLTNQSRSLAIILTDLEYQWFSLEDKLSKQEGC